MKKTIIIAAMLLSVISCTKTVFEGPEGRPESSKTVRIHAAAPETKAIHGTGSEDGTSFVWEAGKDDINLIWLHNENEYTNLNGPARFINKNNGAEACFEAAEQMYTPVSVGDTLYAIYPYKSSTHYSWWDSEKGEDVSCFRTSFGSTMQVGDNNTSHMDKLDIMISRPVTVTESMVKGDGSYDIPMQFAHLFSKVRVNVVNSTSAPFEINSLVYHSTKTDDLLSGVIYMNMKTREILAEAKEYGDCAPSSNAILQTSGITVPAGGSATLWMWMMPLDFTAGNAAGRTANIYLNTSAGIFHVDGVNFDQPLEAGKTYRHKFTATDSKKLEGYTLIPDACFVKALLAGTFDYMVGPAMTFYDFSFNPVDFSSFDPYGSNPEDDAKCAGGLFVKNSEVDTLSCLNIQANNAVSLEGLQAFKGLTNLSMFLSMDMSSVLSVRSLDISALTELEEFFLSNSQISFFDVSKNTKLRKMSIDYSGDLKSITGLKDHPSIEAIDFKQVGLDAGGFSANLSGCPKLKSVCIDSDVDALNLSNLELDFLYLGSSTFAGTDMTGLKVSDLYLYNAPALPQIPGNVRKLTLGNLAPGNSAVSQLGSFDSIDTLYVNGWNNFDCNVVFGEANKSIKVAEISLTEGYDAVGGTVSGIGYLTGVDSLVFYASREETSTAEPMNADFSTLTNCRILDVTMGSLFNYDNYKLPAGNKLETASIRFNDASYPELTIDGLTGLKDLKITVDCNSTSYKLMTLGNLPALENFTFSAAGWSTNAAAVPVFSASSYPKLSKIQMYGRYIPCFPIYSEKSLNEQYSTDSWLTYTHNAFPELTSLSISNSSSTCDSGINGIDLRPFTKLTRFYCFFKYYDINTGTVKERDQESVYITQSQADYTNNNIQYGSAPYEVSWYYGSSSSYHGTINITTSRTKYSSYYYGGYSKVMPDIDFSK